MKPAPRSPRVVPPVPGDLATRLAADPKAAAVFDKLSPTHRREHIEALLEARKPETRARRLDKTMTMLRTDRPSLSNTISTRPAVLKMKIAPPRRVLALEADDDAMQMFNALPAGCSLDRKASRGADYGTVILFALTAAGLKRHLGAAIAASGTDTRLWIAYPKQSSGRATTLTRDIGWEATDRDDLERKEMIALDDTWAAVRFRVG